MAVSKIINDKVVRHSNNVLTATINRETAERLDIMLITGTTGDVTEGSLRLVFNRDTAYFQRFDGATWVVLKTW